MKTYSTTLACALALLCSIHISFGTERFVSLLGAHQAPFTSWADAATNIQDAIDAAAPGDVVWVTNGVYSTGGKAMAGNMTNRIALDKALSLRSVNGPEVTIIQGKWDATTNGATAIRCAWLTNGASLYGFTLQGGATRPGGDPALSSGGGIWCVSSNALIEDCIIRSNAAPSSAAVNRGNLRNCFITENRYTSTINPVVASAVLNNCTVVGNLSVGVSQSVLTNCIVYFNTTTQALPPHLNSNYVGTTFSYSCTIPLPPGLGNISSDPQLFSDNLHFANTSPCKSLGTNAITAADLRGNNWAIPASMGAVETPSLPVLDAPQVQFTNLAGFSVVANVAGATPLTFRWMHNGSFVGNDEHYNFAGTAMLSVKKPTELDAGDYQVVVSNSFGNVTSAVANLVIRCVNAAGTGPVPPYTNWATAATNIQDAIDAAAAGELVLVTNGVYAFGGKSMSHTLTNRVTLDKALAVLSVNGAGVTTIRGNLDPATNGLTAIRCAWLTNGAVLNGFTLRDGATRFGNITPVEPVSGGGVFGTSTNALVLNCVIATNYAHYSGGGAYRVSMKNCVLIGNTAGQLGSFVNIGGFGGATSLSDLRNCFITQNFAGTGGGTANSALINCVLTENTAFQFGGAASGGWLLNCNVSSNLSGQGGAVVNVSFTNSIVFNNLKGALVPTEVYNYYNSTSVYSCSFPLAPGTGNIAVDPELLPDGIHLSASSPCRGAGISTVLNGTDMDGQLWGNPPSIGVDEWHPEPVLGGQPRFQISGIPASLKIMGGTAMAGESPFAFSWLKDGEALGSDPRYSPSELNLFVSNLGPADAGNYQIVVSNAFGVATSAVVQVVIHCVNATSSAPVAPYSNWSTAAGNIQDAIDVAEAGSIILVTNGLYSTGGKVMAGDLTNRIAITKPMTVVSVNGPGATVVQGAWDANTNGPAAVRCAWLSDGAVLSGFTLQNGATRSSGGLELENGGGVWGASAQALAVNCFIYTNAANIQGGGVFQASVQRGKSEGTALVLAGAQLTAQCRAVCLLIIRHQFVEVVSMDQK